MICSYLQGKGNIGILKGSIVFTYFTLLFHNPSAFKNTNVFQPSRWDSPTKEASESYIPFSSGKKTVLAKPRPKRNFILYLRIFVQDLIFPLNRKVKCGS
mmetsp:Transcript_8665/g.12532  ORF Transcript_8665/g.12532 Transcript_8665/m.12532 type:complete len:100 (-) Transcript_8665:161-460(-)